MHSKQNNSQIKLSKKWTKDGAKLVKRYQRLSMLVVVSLGDDEKEYEH